MMRCMGLAALAALAACGSKDENAGDTSAGGETGAPSPTTPTGTTTGTTTGSTAAGIEIAGTYVDAFGSTNVIDDSSWTIQFGSYAPSVFAIDSYDNDLDFAIAANDAGNYFYPGAWSRFDWYDDGTDLWYCQTSFDAASAEDAAATPRADDSDPATGGCGEFGWTLLTP